MSIQTTSSPSTPKTSTQTLNEMADILMQKLDRKRIFPPYLNDPEKLMNLTRSSNERPPRPPNGFLLCRKNVHHEAKINDISNMRVISKVSGMLWRSATPDEKEQYEKLATEILNLHTKKYPNYKYRPNIISSKGSIKARDLLSSTHFSPYGLPSPPYSTISTPTLTTPLPLIQSSQIVPSSPIYSIPMFPNGIEFTPEQHELFVMYLRHFNRFNNNNNNGNNGNNSNHHNNNRIHNNCNNQNFQY